MRYMTKEWYNTMQKTSFHLQLKSSKLAETFSEEYFNKLYKRKESEWLQLQENVSNVKVEDIYPEEFYMENVEGTEVDPDEYEKAKKEYFYMRSKALLEYEKNPLVFNAEQEKKNFKRALRYNVKHLKENLPESILQKVADIRVLALNYASTEVKKGIAAFCKENFKSCTNAMRAYWKEYKKTFKGCEPVFAGEFNLHDCKVISCRQKGDDLLLGLDNSGGFTAINKAIFKDFIIINQDKPIKGAWWLYDETYKIDKGYEIHVLLQNKDLIEFTVSVSNLEFES